MCTVHFTEYIFSLMFSPQYSDYCPMWQSFGFVTITIVTSTTSPSCQAQPCCFMVLASVDWRIAVYTFLTVLTHGKPSSRVVSAAFWEVALSLPKQICFVSPNSWRNMEGRTKSVKQLQYHPRKPGSLYLRGLRRKRPWVRGCYSTCVLLYQRASAWSDSDHCGKGSRGIELRSVVDIFKTMRGWQKLPLLKIVITNLLHSQRSQWLK